MKRRDHNHCTVFGSCCLMIVRFLEIYFGVFFFFVNYLCTLTAVPYMITSTVPSKTVFVWKPIPIIALAPSSFACSEASSMRSRWVSLDSLLRPLTSPPQQAWRHMQKTTHPLREVALKQQNLSFSKKSSIFGIPCWQPPDPCIPLTWPHKAGLRYTAPLSDVWLTCWSLMLDASVGTVLVSEGFSTLSDFASIQVSCATNDKTIRESSITRFCTSCFFPFGLFQGIFSLALCICSSAFYCSEYSRWLWYAQIPYVRSTRAINNKSERRTMSTSKAKLTLNELCWNVLYVLNTVIQNYCSILRSKK